MDYERLIAKIAEMLTEVETLKGDNFDNLPEGDALSIERIESAVGWVEWNVRRAIREQEGRA
ncbi:MAG: hypothetical protein LC114_25085 [Bryobacterales bacterium]|nr:hypothetical protein [Bryobacterales bacterium]